MQPIHVVDLADQLADIYEHPDVEGTVIELGGSLALPVGELVSRIRKVERGRPGPWVTLPVGLMRTALGLLEPVLLPLLPLTAGQLASFVTANDGTARADPPGGLRRPSRDLDEMLGDPSHV